MEGRQRLWLTGAGVRTLILKTLLRQKEREIATDGEHMFPGQNALSPERGCTKFYWGGFCWVCQERKQEYGPEIPASSSLCTGTNRALQHDRVAAGFPAGLEPPCMPWCSEIINLCWNQAPEEQQCCPGINRCSLPVPHRSVSLSEPVKERSLANNFLGVKARQMLVLSVSIYFQQQCTLYCGKINNLSVCKYQMDLWILSEASQDCSFACSLAPWYKAFPYFAYSISP